MNEQQIVYVVDDDDLVRDTLKAVLQSVGFKVHVFESADAFLKHSVTTENACLILDLRMPHSSGLDVQRELSQRAEKLPIIFYTGNADVSLAVRVMREGAFTLLEKPLSNELLIENVRNAITNYQRVHSRERELNSVRTALASLTDRELEISRLLADGKSSLEISRRLFISARTVDAHRSNIFSKLGIRSVAKLAQMVTMVDSTEESDTKR